jgi:hypothetical protein
MKAYRKVEIWLQASLTSALDVLVTVTPKKYATPPFK